MCQIRSTHIKTGYCKTAAYHIPFSELHIANSESRELMKQMLTQLSPVCCLDCKKLTLHHIPLMPLLSCKWADITLVYISRKPGTELTMLKMKLLVMEDNINKHLCKLMGTRKRARFTDKHNQNIKCKHSIRIHTVRQHKMSTKEYLEGTAKQTESQLEKAEHIMRTF